MTNKQMEILRNIIGAVETGGQVYGKQRYDAFANPGANTEKEKYITLGAWQFYGTESTELLRMIRKNDAAGFKSLDTQGIGKDLDNSGFVAYIIKNTTAKAKCIVEMISSTAGIACQNELINARLELYINRAKTNGVTDIQAQMMWANMQHLGGKDAAERVLKNCKKPYTLDSLYTGLNKDLETNAQYPNRIGAKRFNSRHVKVYGWIKQYVTSDTVKEETNMAISIVLAGHGSGKPSTKGLNAYCSSRQAAGRGLVEVRRLPGINDVIRKAMHDFYKSILGRNLYSQGLRDYCYTAYKGAYYSDCSSSICRTAQKAGISGVASLNTAGMHYNWTKVSGVVISSGIIQNPEILKTGDALMFKGSDPSRPLQIGHTEMVYEINGTAATAATPTASTGNSVVAAGQMHTNNFTDAGLAVDGERGALTKKAGIKVLQTAINLDYGTGLEVDGDWGSKSDKGLTGHYTRKGETQHMVTALEILLMLKGYNPNGVECPGVFGSGLEATVRKHQADHGLIVDGIAGYNTYKSLVS